MSFFSRREFLRRSSAAIIGASRVNISSEGGLPSSSASIPDLNGPLTTGRAFLREAVYAKQDTSSAIVEYLAPDGVYPIVQTVGEWYQTSGGFVRREAVQPIQPYVRPPIIENGEMWAEVIAPVSAIREWCAGHAPIAARLDFGAVVYVTDRLRDDGGLTWYGLTDRPDSQLIGWASALQYASLTLTALVDPPNQPSIHFDIGQQRLIVYDEGRPVGTSPICGSMSGPTRDGLARAIEPGGRVDGKYPLGVPWIMEISTDSGIYPIYGAFWHNRFGIQRPNILDNASIELPTAAARWLYSWITGYGKPINVSLSP